MTCVGRSTRQQGSEGVVALRSARVSAIFSVDVSGSVRTLHEEITETGAIQHVVWRRRSHAGGSDGVQVACGSGRAEATAAEGRAAGARRLGRGGWGEAAGARQLGRGGWGDAAEERGLGRGGWGEAAGARRLGRGGWGRTAEASTSGKHLRPRPLSFLPLAPF
eukprot:266716-Chlamydomonas_euryale.AAC.1